MTDVLLFDTPDGGNIEYKNGKATLEDGLQTAGYLSLFGGNQLDNGSQATQRQQWWGNLIEDDPNARYRSEFQNLLSSLPVTTSNIRRLEDAAFSDLSWLLDRWVSKIRVSITMPQRNFLDVRIDLTVSGEIITLSFRARWESGS